MHLGRIAGTSYVLVRMRTIAFVLAVLPFAIGCSKESGGSASTSSGSPSVAATGSAASLPGSPAAPAAPTAGANVTEIDLATADPAWKGWTVQGPKDAKVLADGVHGARVAANGMDAFDLAFTQGKSPMKDVKSGVEAGAKGGNLKVTYGVDTADKLEWVTEVAGTKVHNFVWNYKVAGKDVSCRTNAAMGTTDAMAAQMKTACGTLQKK